MPIKKISVIIPALNEEKAIGPVIDQIPIELLKNKGCETEIIVVDNGSIDKTAEIAKKKGARVIFQPIRGYGKAYKTGFNEATGDIIITGDADMTYPFDAIPEFLEEIQKKNLDFLNTDRLSNLSAEAMTSVHAFGNKMLSLAAKMLFRWTFRDSQSGMWIFRREIWPRLDVHSNGMPFSQELKIEVFTKDFRHAEIPINYRARIGIAKLQTIKDGIRNITHLFIKKLHILKNKQ